MGACGLRCAYHLFVDASTLESRTKRSHSVVHGAGWEVRARHSINGRSLEAGKRHRFAQASTWGCVFQWRAQDGLVLGSRVALRFDLGNRLCNLEIHPQNDETTDAVSHMHAVVSELKRACSRRRRDLQEQSAR